MRLEVRAVGEQDVAALKGRFPLRKRRCSTRRITDFVKDHPHGVRNGLSTASPSSIPTFMAKSNRSNCAHNSTSAG